MMGELLSFHLVKKMGEGSYLNEDRFILERIRKERAHGACPTDKKRKNKRFSVRSKNGRFNCS